ncbi:DUF2914 domain-containing protein [candidate division KSB1 bacterium]|nr:DUF2914 domain-containing protein [candidate division KSB1 bacterium]
MFKSAFQIKWKDLLGLLFLVFGFIVVLSLSTDSPQHMPDKDASVPAITQPSVPANNHQAALTAPGHPSITIEEAVICLDVDQGEPLLAKSRFSRLIDRLYCFVALTSRESRTTLIHLWYLDERLVQKKTFSIDAGSHKLISSLETRPEWSGQCRVVVANASGRQLHVIPFVLE